jgi:nanoRNase/pAp phosphatase (c-di-AMP/oligoRNAs hydrolase)
MPRYILYHANCPDGFGAAWSAYHKFGSEAVYLPVRHGNPLPEMADGSEVYILDFSYDRATLSALAARCQVKVLDHHKTAQAELEGLACAEFDMERSGAVMAWNYFFPDQPVPALLQYVQTQDLWRWDLPDCHEICAALALYPMDFDIWDQLDTAILRGEGQTTLRYRGQLLENLCQRVDWLEILGHRVPAVNTPLLASELGNLLCQRYPEAPFSVSWSEQKGQRKYSLRSIGAFDVSEICRHYGGGGHRNAAGFSLPLERVDAEIKVAPLA